MVLEGLYDAGNRSAVYRSAEAYGLRDVHIIHPDSAQKPHARAVSRGAEKWLHLHQHASSLDCVSALRSAGFAVYAADLEAAAPLHSLDFSRPTALVFGNEREGISEKMREIADGCFLIPMAGFTSSFNISVAAAISLSHARLARERAIGATTDLEPAEARALLHEFALRSSRWLQRIQERGPRKDSGLKTPKRAP